MSANNKRSAHRTAQSTPPPLRENFRAGLALLRRAYAYAQDTGADVRDFALEINELYETRLTISDLRWLIAKGFAEHGIGRGILASARRRIWPTAGRSLC